MSYVLSVELRSPETRFRAWKSPDMLLALGSSGDISGDGFAPPRVLPGPHPGLPHSRFHAEGGAKQSLAQKRRFAWKGAVSAERPLLGLSRS